MPLALYVHFPFCTNKCSYCDFYKELYHQETERQFFSALKTETQLAFAGLPPGMSQLGSIYIGGGTPSVANLALLADWLGTIRSLFQVPAGIEFSFEMNPESVSRETLAQLKRLGINRPIFGVQSFHPDLLKRLNRRHNPHLSQQAVYLANALGFRNFGIDLIFGLPGQSSKMLLNDLAQAVDLEPPHISFYQLTVEEGTPLAQLVAAGQIRLADNETLLAFYRAGADKMISRGYRRYEVSSFAREGFECVHNKNYWNGGDYLGLGPAAHSFVDGERFHNAPDLNAYIASLGRGEIPRVHDRSGADARMIEAIMLGLRTSEGVRREQFSRRFGRSVEERLNRDQYRRLVDSGHLLTDDAAIRLSDSGIYLADEITRLLLT